MVATGDDGGTAEPDLGTVDTGTFAVNSCSCGLSPVGNSHGAVAMGTACLILGLGLLRRRRAPRKSASN